jgi:HAD superfamily hydrolase (TIGR01509 family)
MPSMHDTIRTVPHERRRIEAVLLDIDGTLVDSNDAHAQAWMTALAEGGFGEQPFERVRRLIGMGASMLLRELLGLAPNDPRVDELDARHGEIFREQHLAGVTLQPGARELIEKLKARGFGIVLATSGSEEDVRALLAQVGLDDLELRRTTADDVRVAKPAPDVVCAGVAKAGTTHQHAILIGDTPYDVKAGRGAGVATIALRCGGWDDAALDGAIEVFDDPSDLLRNWMQTPFRRSLEDLDAPL